MKKLFLLALIPAIWVSCNNSDDNLDNAGNINNDRGSIVLNSGLNADIENILVRSTSTNIEDYTLILVGPDSEEKRMDYPEGGILENLPVGLYTITLTSHPDGYVSAFDQAVYEATASVTVEKDEDKEVAMTCIQVNAGVYFDYDASLADAGLGNVVATVVQGDDDSLVYSADTPDAVGYFKPGEVTISFTNGGNPVTIGGDASKTITVDEKELWKITIKAASTEPADPYGAPGAAGPQIIINFEDLGW